MIWSKENERCRRLLALFALVFWGAGEVVASGLEASAEGDKQVEIANEPIGYHWQQGVWFSFLVKYRNPYLSNEAEEIIKDRDHLVEALKRVQHRTGFTEDGRYDRSLVGDNEAIGGFAFNLDTLKPVNRNLFYDADITGDPQNPDDSDIVRISIEWAGANASTAPLDVTRPFDRYQEGRGTAPNLFQGHLTTYTQGSLPPAGYLSLNSDHSNVDYRLYEQGDGLIASLRCNVMNGTSNRRNVQPLCDGKVRELETNTILYLLFPEHLIWSERSWMQPAKAAFFLVNSWRIKR
ncbi:hypothetical protein [Aquicoccus porphyridii]|uniref:Uncharacterized protein n=1 Tax=Aquicoccus porphyridii TaxID=1852029 RepID=A0A5A9YX08_9RHOB|nr:hypothetical protein [Aquicoccus porphyridii]KAA0909418.1 hypothetical protein FLO80_21645 [Aquicoccus porphyridii]